MDYAYSLFKAYQLHELYLSLTPHEKNVLPHLVPPPSDGQRGQSSADIHAFAIHTATRLLWVTAANAIPQGYYELAEKLLQAALHKNPQGDDAAWVHVNLAQLYFDTVDANPEALCRCREHLTDLEQMKYFLPWVKGMQNQLNEGCYPALC